MEIYYKICIDSDTKNIHVIIDGVPDNDIADFALSFIADIDKKITHYMTHHVSEDE